MAYNSLEEFPEELSELESLEELNLIDACKTRQESTDLLTIPEALKNLKNLKKFEFYESKIGHGFNSTTINYELKDYYLKKLEAVLPADCEIKVEYF